MRAAEQRNQCTCMMMLLLLLLLLLLTLTLPAVAGQCLCRNLWMQWMWAQRLKGTSPTAEFAAYYAAVQRVHT